MNNRCLSLLVVIWGLEYVAVAQISAPTGQQQPDAKAQYEGLTRRIYGAVERPSREEYEKTTTQVRTLVAERLKAVLARSDDPADVRKAVRDVQGKFDLSSWGPQTTNVPFAERFQVHGQPGLAVAFVILRGGTAIPDTLPVLRFYTKQFGEWKLRAEIDTDLHSCGYIVSSLDSPVPDETWWLAWGQMMGDNGARRKVRLYAFDGETVKTVWQRDELRAGSISVAKDRKAVVLEYYRKEGTPEQPKPDLRIREEWYLTPDGPQRTSSVVVGDAGSL